MGSACSHATDTVAQDRRRDARDYDLLGIPVRTHQTTQEIGTTETASR